MRTCLYLPQQRSRDFSWGTAPGAGGDGNRFESWRLRLGDLLALGTALFLLYEVGVEMAKDNPGPEPGNLGTP